MRRVIRTRAIDNFRKLPISAEPGIIFDDEESLDDILPKRATVVELPIPEAGVVTTYEDENKPDFKLPSYYLRHQTKLDDDIDKELEYDLDWEDMVRGGWAGCVGLGFWNCHPPTSLFWPPQRRPLRRFLWPHARPPPVYI
jgi:hypothetical protein